MTATKPKILLVDDEAFYLELLVNLLQHDYTISVAKNGAEAIKLLEVDPLPELILMDVIMPVMTGLEACSRIKSKYRTADIPIIFLNIKSDIKDEMVGFNLGAADYITKPISPPLVKARVKTHIQLYNSQKQLQSHNIALEKKLREHDRHIIQTQEMAIHCMASLADTGSSGIGQHTRRIQHYVKAIAHALKEHDRFTHEISDEFINMLYKSAPLYDLGKLAVPDHILLKPGKLDEEEWEEVKAHTRHAKQALEYAEQQAGQSQFLNMVREICYSHHERWDGSGYPDSLSGERIPLSARIIAIADCYDALIRPRPYKHAFNHEEAIAIIQAAKNKHFDPDIADIFLQLAPEITTIAKKYAD